MRLLFAACLMGSLLMPVLAADSPNPKQTFLDAESAGPDFAIQGEYEGVIGRKTRVGAQVIARGNGQFEAVLLAKGLPGGGWDLRSRVELTGESKDGVVEMKGTNFRGEIRDGVLSGKAEADVDFRLTKVFRTSSTLGAAPPEGAIVLFDGKNTDAWTGAKLEDGDLLGVGGRTKQSFRDFHLHLEFRSPFQPFARGQARGNSGMYLLNQYEVQILDSFGLTGLDNECGGIYKASAPRVNMCLPPLSWQTYDVDFTAARFDDAGKKTADAVVTVRHNGVVIHDKLALKTSTPGGGQSDEKPGPLFLQNHGDAVRFRNIWLVEKP